MQNGWYAAGLSYGDGVRGHSGVESGQVLWTWLVALTPLPPISVFTKSLKQMHHEQHGTPAPQTSQRKAWPPALLICLLSFLSSPPFILSRAVW